MALVNSGKGNQAWSRACACRLLGPPVVAGALIQCVFWLLLPEAGSCASCRASSCSCCSWASCRASSPLVFFLEVAAGRAWLMLRALLLAGTWAWLGVGQMATSTMAKLSTMSRCRFKGLICCRVKCIKCPQRCKATGPKATICRPSRCYCLFNRGFLA